MTALNIFYIVCNIYYLVFVVYCALCTIYYGIFFLGGGGEYGRLNHSLDYIDLIFELE